MNIILCGFNWAGCKALELLVGKGNNLFVYTHKTPPSLQHDLGDMCKHIGIPFSFGDISKQELPFEPDFICSIYYRYRIKEWVIDSCKGKIFNLHPSLLPKYRGCSSITWALINGEKEIGFTYHYIDKDFDTGPILLQKKIPVELWDTQLSLYYKAMFLSMDYFVEAKNMVIKGVPGAPQKGEGSYYNRSLPYNGEIDSLWEEDFVERFIRAMFFPPKPGATYKGHIINSIEEYKRIIGDE